MSIQIPEGAVRELVAQSILESISAEAREKILSDAIAGLLLTPPRSGYGTQPQSPLKEAFDNAVRATVNGEARRLLEESEAAQARIKAMVGEAIVDLCSDNYDGLPEKIGEAIGAWLQDRNR